MQFTEMEGGGGEVRESVGMRFGFLGVSYTLSFPLPNFFLLRLALSRLAKKDKEKRKEKGGGLGEYQECPFIQKINPANSWKTGPIFELIYLCD